MKEMEGRRDEYSIKEKPSRGLRVKRAKQVNKSNQIYKEFVLPRHCYIFTKNILLLILCRDVTVN